MKGKWLLVIYIIVQKISPVLVWQKRGFYLFFVPADAKKLSYSLFVQIFQVSNLKVMVE